VNKLGYEFYFKIGEEILTLPITPEKLNIKVGSKNEVVTLINEGEINILKSPSLLEFEFEAIFPEPKNYPFARKALNFEQYWDKFQKLKVGRRPCEFTVIRTTPDGKGTWGTVRQVTIEEFETTEDAANGMDVIVSFKLKEYKDYGVKIQKVANKSSATNRKTTSTSKKPRSDKGKTSKSKTHTVKKGDCLWNISKKYYGSGAKWKKIYTANKTVIENTAKKYRKGKGSSNGHWIYPGTKLTIPAL
jgi:LysM repeat protein